MSVLAEGFSVIVRRSTIENDVPGGIETYGQLIPNRTFCADQYLTRVGFLDWEEANKFLARLRAFGLTHHNVDEGPDVGVLHQDEGFLGVVPWLEWHRDQTGLSIAWLTGTQPGELATPVGWSHNSALRYIENAEAPSRLIPLEAMPDHAAFLDSASGEVLYGLKSASASTDAISESMAAIKQATDQLRVIRDQVGPIYVYYFPKTWLQVIARSLHVTEQPDFGRYTAQLNTFRGSATRIANESKTAFEVVALADIDSDIKESARLSHLQVFYDANWVILFCKYVEAMRDMNPEALGYFRVMADFSHKAHANLAELQRAGARLARKYNRPSPF